MRKTSVPLTTFVILLVICSTATPILQRIPNEMQNPRLLQSAIWKRVEQQQEQGHARASPAQPSAARWASPGPGRGVPVSSDTSSR